MDSDRAERRGVRKPRWSVSRGLPGRVWADQPVDDGLSTASRVYEPPIGPACRMNGGLACPRRSVPGASLLDQLLRLLDECGFRSERLDQKLARPFQANAADPELRALGQ